MKKIKLFAFLLLFLATLTQAQTLKSGYYVTDDGQHHRNIEVMTDGTIRAGISVGYDVYKNTYGNKYKGVTTVTNGVAKPASSVFYLEIVSPTSIFLYRDGSVKTKLTLQGTDKILDQMDDCTLYQKYMDKIESDPNNVQAWSFCANAALQLCNAPDDNARNTILQQTVITLKALYPDKPCPCSDVIPSSAWKKY